MNKREKQIVYRVKQALINLPYYRNPMGVKGVSGYSLEAHDVIVKGTRILTDVIYGEFNTIEEQLAELETYVENIRKQHQLAPYL